MSFPISVVPLIHQALLSVFIKIKLISHTLTNALISRICKKLETNYKKKVLCVCHFIAMSFPISVVPLNHQALLSVFIKIKLISHTLTNALISRICKKLETNYKKKVLCVCHFIAMSFPISVVPLNHQALLSVFIKIKLISHTLTNALISRICKKLETNYKKKVLCVCHFIAMSFPISVVPLNHQALLSVFIKIKLIFHTLTNALISRICKKLETNYKKKILCIFHLIAISFPISVVPLNHKI